MADPVNLGAAGGLADSEHSLAVDVLDFRPSQGSAILVEEAGGGFQELQPPSEHLVLVFDIGKLGQKGEDDHEPPKVSDVPTGGCPKTTLKVFSSVGRELECVALGGAAVLNALG